MASAARARTRSATRHAQGLDSLSSDVLQHVFAQAGAEAGVRLAACSRRLHSEAARCRALWDHVLLHGLPRNYRVLAAAVRALTAEEAPALEAGSELLGRVGKATVLVALFGTHETHMHEARWVEGLRFKEVRIREGRRRGARDERHGALPAAPTGAV